MSRLHRGGDEPFVLRALGNGIDGTLVILGAAIICLVFANVLSRGLLNVDVAFTTELCEMLLLWVTLLGAAAAARRRSHMRVTEILMLIGSGELRRWVEILVDVLVLGMLASLVWYGAIIVNANWDNLLTVLYIPMAVQYLSLPVGSALTFLYVAHDLSALIRRRMSFQDETA